MPRRILVTRAPHQASALAEALRIRGAEPILIPAIELTGPATWRPLDDALAKLATFDWLLFTSANAVHAFAKRLGPRLQSLCGTLEKEEKPGFRIAAIGPSTARALEAIGLAPDLVPPQAVAESFANALVPYAQAGTHFLLIRAEQARDHVPETLRSAGGSVTIAPAYRNVVPSGSVEQIRRLFSTDPPDAITFTSSSSVVNLLELLAEAGLELPQAIRRISIGPVTSAALRQAGFPPHAEAEEPNVASLAAACF